MFEAQHVIRADIVVLAQGLEVTDGHFVDAVLIPGIDLLGRAQHVGDGALLQVAILPQLAEDFPILLHANTSFIDVISRRSIFTSKEVY